MVWHYREIGGVFFMSDERWLITVRCLMRRRVLLYNITKKMRYASIWLIIFAKLATISLGEIWVIPEKAPRLRAVLVRQSFVSD